MFLLSSGTFGKIKFLYPCLPFDSLIDHPKYWQTITLFLNLHLVPFLPTVKHSVLPFKVPEPKTLPWVVVVKVYICIYIFKFNLLFFNLREERGGERFDRREYRTDKTTSGFYGESGGDGRGRGRSGPQRGNFIRGGRGGRGSQRPTFDVRGKREYDRQSGSDKT